MPGARYFTYSGEALAVALLVFIKTALQYKIIAHSYRIDFLTGYNRDVIFYIPIMHL